MFSEVEKSCIGNKWVKNKNQRQYLMIQLRMDEPMALFQTTYCQDLGSCVKQRESKNIIKNYYY